MGTVCLGRATALTHAKEGVNIVIADRRVNEGEETVRLVKQIGGDGIFVKTYVVNEDNIRLLIVKTIMKYGMLDYAFNSGT